MFTPFSKAAPILVPQIVRKGGTDLKEEFVGDVTKRKREEGRLKRAAAAAAAAAAAVATAASTAPSAAPALAPTCDATGRPCGCYASTTARARDDYELDGPWLDSFKKDKVVYYCACGQSTMWPYCSGMHTEVNAREGLEFKPFAVEVPEDVRDKAMCKCGHSKNRPYCDGTHSCVRMPVE